MQVSGAIPIWRSKVRIIYFIFNGGLCLMSLSATQQLFFQVILKTRKLSNTPTTPDIPWYREPIVIAYVTQVLPLQIVLLFVFFSEPRKIWLPTITDDRAAERWFGDNFRSITLITEMKEVITANNALVNDKVLAMEVKTDRLEKCIEKNK